MTTRSPRFEAHAVALPRAAAAKAGVALLLVDLQCDFLPGGALAVRGGDSVIVAANRCIDAFTAHGLPVFASRDWHPLQHASFRDQGGPWPVHCVAGSDGAAFAAGLCLPAMTQIVSKGTRPGADAYSPFQGTGFAQALREAGIARLVVAGLATDYCVLHTVLDALALGLAVTVVGDGIAAVNVKQDDGEAAIAEMKSHGATFTDSHALRRQLDAWAAAAAGPVPVGISVRAGVE